MRFQATVRYGDSRVSYHTLEVEGAGVREALRAVADAIPDEVADAADLVELRTAVDPDSERPFIGG